MQQNIGLCFVIVPVLVQGKSLLGCKKGRFPYRNVLRTSALGLKCKQKHDLLLGVVYPFKLKSKKVDKSDVAELPPSAQMLERNMKEREK